MHFATHLAPEDEKASRCPKPEFPLAVAPDVGGLIDIQCPQECWIGAGVGKQPVVAKGRDPAAYFPLCSLFCGHPMEFL